MSVLWIAAGFVVGFYLGVFLVLWLRRCERLAAERHRVVVEFATPTARDALARLTGDAPEASSNVVRLR